MNFYIDRVLAQQIVDTVKDICERHINFIDHTGTILASTNESRVGTFHEIGKKAIETGIMIEVDSDNQFAGARQGVNLPVFYKNRIACVIGISGPPNEIKKYAYLAEKITHILLHEKELNQFSRSQTEKKHFIIHSLVSRETSNYEYVSELMNTFRLDTAKPKRMLLFRTIKDGNTTNAGIEQSILAFFESVGVVMYARHYPDSFLAVTDDVIFAENISQYKKFASAYDRELIIAAGKTVPLFQLADSYDSCLTTVKSMEQMSVNFLQFDDLTLEIILSSVTPNHRQEYIAKTIAGLTNEERVLLETYFEEDMSLADTSRRLFLHKNTLQNKLIKISASSGYNPRKFRDAAVLYLALKLFQK